MINIMLKGLILFNESTQQADVYLGALKRFADEYAPLIVHAMLKNRHMCIAPDFACDALKDLFHHNGYGIEQTDNDQIIIVFPSYNAIR